MRRTLTRIAVAAATALTATSALLTPATAAGNGNIVTFGDSYFSNPDMIDNFQANRGMLPAGRPTNHTGCAVSTDNFAHQLGQITGRPVDDWSCTGTTAPMMLGAVRAAIAAGDVHHGTRTVFMGSGANDLGPPGVFDRAGRGANPLDALGEMRPAYVEAANLIRQAAPNAQIKLLGLPEIMDTAGMFCPVQVVPEFPMGIPLSRQIETTIADHQRNAAAAAGIEYIDVRSETAGHGTCSTPDASRYVAGVVDTTSPRWHYVVHPTVEGSAAMARIASRYV